jgi:glutamyl-tRNA reductase
MDRPGDLPGLSLRLEEEPEMAKVAFIGLGVMGYPMAGFLKTKGGHDVTVYNRTTAKAKKWATEYGGAFCPDPGTSRGRL